MFVTPLNLFLVVVFVVLFAVLVYRLKQNHS